MDNIVSGLYNKDEVLKVSTTFLQQAIAVVSEILDKAVTEGGSPPPPPAAPPSPRYYHWTKY